MHYYSFAHFLDASTKLRKDSISFVMSVRPPVGIEKLGSQRTDFHENLHLSIFRKCQENSNITKTEQE